MIINTIRPFTVKYCILRMYLDTYVDILVPYDRDFQPKLNIWNSLWLNDWQYSIIFTDHFGENFSSIACSYLEIQKKMSWR